MWYWTPVRRQAGSRCNVILRLLNAAQSRSLYYTHGPVTLWHSEGNVLSNCFFGLGAFIWRAQLQIGRLSGDVSVSVTVDA